MVPEYTFGKFHFYRNSKDILGYMSSVIRYFH